MAAPSVEVERASERTPAVVVRRVGIRDLPLSVDEVLAAVADPAAGGTTAFVGTVRSSDGGRDVSALRYEAHPDAIIVLQDLIAIDWIAQVISKRRPEIQFVANQVSRHLDLIFVAMLDAAEG